MERINGKRTVKIFVCCAVISLMLTGCSSYSIFSYLKFWGTKDQKRVDEETAMQASAFMSKIKPARGNPDSHYRLGVHYQMRGRYQEAIEEFTKAISIDPGYVYAYNGLGIAFDNLKEPARARVAYRMALKAAPGDPHAYNNLGYSFILVGDYRSAVEILLEGLSVRENDRHMRNNLAMAYTALGERDLARVELEKAGRAGTIESVTQDIEQRLGRLELERPSEATAQKEISSEDIAPVPAKNRFVDGIKRSLARAGKVKARPVRSIDLRTPRLKPGYLMIAQAEDKKDLVASPGSSDMFIRDIVMTRTTEDLDDIKSLSRIQSWF